MFWVILEIYLLLDDKKLPLNHRHRVHANGTLEIIHLDKNSDSGIYSCIALGNTNTERVTQSFLMQVRGMGAKLISYS